MVRATGRISRIHGFYFRRGEGDSFLSRTVKCTRSRANGMPAAIWAASLCPKHTHALGFPPAWVSERDPPSLPPSLPCEWEPKPKQTRARCHLVNIGEGKCQAVTLTFAPTKLDLFKQNILAYLSYMLSFLVKIMSKAVCVSKIDLFFKCTRCEWVKHFGVCWKV